MHIIHDIRSDEGKGFEQICKEAKKDEHFLVSQFSRLKESSIKCFSVKLEVKVIFTYCLRQEAHTQERMMWACVFTFKELSSRQRRAADVLSHRLDLRSPHISHQCTIRESAEGSQRICESDGFDFSCGHFEEIGVTLFYKGAQFSSLCSTHTVCVLNPEPQCQCSMVNSHGTN